MAVVDPFTACHYLGRGIVCRRFEPALPYETAAIFPLHRQRARVVEEFADLAHRIIGESAAAFVNRTEGSAGDARS